MNPTSALESILGSGSDEIVSSGDAVADKAALKKFVQRYDAVTAKRGSSEACATRERGKLL